jgi:hypothetical protein
MAPRPQRGGGRGGGAVADAAAGAVADFGARAGAPALSAARGSRFPCADGRAVRGDL